MSVVELERAPRQDFVARTGVVDCDVHAVPKSPAEFREFLPQRWRDHLATFGPRGAKAFAGAAVSYPRVSVGAGRRMDSWPPGGGPPGSDLAFMQKQLLDPCNILYAIIHPLATGHHTLNLDLGAAMCRAVNEWQVAHWTSQDRRMKASVAIAQEDTPTAVKEIERCAGSRDFCQVAIPPRTIEPQGRRRYWPIYEAAARAGLPVAMHNSAHGPHAPSGSGYFSFYLEDHYVMAHCMQSVITSMVMEGVFEAIPDLKLVLVEGGFAWAAALAWRLDRLWERLRAEVPHLKRPPSEYMRTNIWYTTQPMEESEKPEHLADVIRWMGADRLLFSTDYPHWDFDDPRTCFQTRLPNDTLQKVLRDNAMAVFPFE